MDADTLGRLQRLDLSSRVPADLQERETSPMQIDAEDDAWSELPEEIVGNIQARLPLVSLLRSRVVCKEWNEAVASPWLLQERLFKARAGDLGRERLLCVVSLDESEQSDMACCVYERASDRWYELQLPPWLRTLAAERGSVQLLDLPRGSPGCNGVLLSTMYMLSWIHARSILQIGNPVAGSWTSLPELPEGLEIKNVVGVFEDANSHSFKLVVLGDFTIPRPPRYLALDEIDPMIPIPAVTYVYDSALGSWSAITSELPGRVRKVWAMGQWVWYQGVFVGPVLYYLADKWANLLAYDLEEAKWRWLEVVRPALGVSTLFSARLVTVRERLLCVALCGCNLGFVQRDDKRVEIWELDFGRMAWMAVDSMPASIFTHFRPKCSFLRHIDIDKFAYSVKVVAGQDLEVYLITDKVDKVVAVDLQRTPGSAAWRWLPACPYKQFKNKHMYGLDPWFGIKV